MQQVQNIMSAFVHQTTLGKNDIDLSLANQTQQNIQVFTLPANARILLAEIANINSANITSTGTLNFLNCSLGSTSGGTDIVYTNDLQITGNSANYATPYVSSSSPTKIYFGIVPVGSGSNFNTLTMDANSAFKVSIVYYILG